ncbi:ankyrin [Podospora conica]|nr:ankyrin [Schizothecium conicum]
MGNTSSTGIPSSKALTTELRKTPPTSTSTIALLLSRGADPNAPGTPTPLIAAVTSGCMPTIQLLVDHGALTNRPGHGPSKYHGTPLMAAATEGNYEAATFLLTHGAGVNGPSMTIPPLVAAIHAKNLGMLEFLLSRGADPNKSTFGMRPARFVLGEATCWHDVRKPPRQSCKTCQERLLWLHMLAALRKHGGRPLVAGSGGGGGDALMDAYVDLIAHTEKWEERGERAAQFLVDATVNDPVVRMMLDMLVRAGLGAIGIPTPVTSLGGAFGAAADVPWPEYDPNPERLDVKTKKKKVPQWDPRTR